jgi:hypothetical protein
VRRDGIAVGVPAVAADELDRVVEAGQAHGDVQRAAAHVGFDPGGALDNIDEAFAYNCEHAHTLPEDRLTSTLLSTMTPITASSDAA